MPKERPLLTDSEEKVLKIIIEKNDMGANPFLELAVFCSNDDKSLDDDVLLKIVKRLALLNLVSISRPDNIEDMIVTLREKGRRYFS